MKIQISVSANDFVYNISVDTKSNFFVCNGKTKKTDIHMFKEKLFDIIFCWEQNMVVETITDAQTYKISVQNNNENITFVGKGKYPPNYNQFISLLREVDNNE